MLRAKIHRITVTERDIEYEGSLTLDALLMQAADLLPFERVEVYDVDNGNRFATYLIQGEAGSGACCVNGAAARLVEVGHKLILATYLGLEENLARQHRPKILLVDERNRLRSIKDGETAGVRVAAGAARTA
jgi:aspartate 1-decarboxylase